MIKDSVAIALADLDFDRDVRPHLRIDRGLLVWAGPIDRRNRAPFVDTPAGRRLHVRQLLGLLLFAEEFDPGPLDLGPGFLLAYLSTPKGQLRRWKRRPVGIQTMGPLVDPRALVGPSAACLWRRGAPRLTVDEGPARYMVARMSVQHAVIKDYLLQEVPVRAALSEFAW